MNPRLARVPAQFTKNTPGGKALRQSTTSISKDHLPTTGRSFCRTLLNGCHHERPAQPDERGGSIHGSQVQNYQGSLSRPGVALMLRWLKDCIYSSIQGQSSNPQATGS